MRITKIEIEGREGRYATIARRTAKRAATTYAATDRMMGL